MPITHQIKKPGGLTETQIQEDGDARYLKLDQVTPQTISNGVPLMSTAVDGAGSQDQLVNKAYVDLAVSSLELTEYFHDEADALGGLYYVMSNVEDSAAGTVTSAGVVAGTTNIFNFITPSGQPHLDRLISGVYDSHVHAYRSVSVTRTVLVFFRLFKRVTGGTETQVGGDSETYLLTTTSTDYTIHMVIPTDQIIDVTDRLVIKWYAVSTGVGGANPTVTIDTGGTVDSNFSIKVEATELSSIFVPYTGAESNLNLGAKNFLTTGTIGGGAITSSTLTDTKLPVIGTAGLLQNSAGTGFVKTSSGVVSYDNSTYLTSVTAHNILSATHADTTVATPARDEVLKWNGSAWVNAVYSATFAMTISSFDDNQSSPQLIGSGNWKTVGQITFTAAYNNPPPNSASIALSGTGMSGGFPITLTTPFTSGANTGTTTYPSAADVTATFTITAMDGATPRTSTTTVVFNNYLYYGNSTTGSSFSEANVEALTGAISSSFTTSRAINAGASNYVVWAYPSRYTSIHATGAIFNSVTMPFTAPETVSITNSAGFVENYKVFASTAMALGNSTLQLSTSSTTLDPIYWGVTTKTATFLESDIEGLGSNSVSNTKGRTITPTVGSGEYVLYCLPTRLGTVTFSVDGFGGGFQAPETVAVTNVNGYTENYYAYRSTNSNIGTPTIVVT